MKLKNEIARLSEGKMLVVCTSIGNPDFGQYLPLSDPEAFVVSSFEQASAACREYITMWNLGGGNWSGGQVYNTEGNKIAEISYNGRVWQFKHSREGEIALSGETVKTFQLHYKQEYEKLIARFCNV